jgi:hypothetical protein
LAAVVLFDAIPTGWISNISQGPVDFLLQRWWALKITIFDAEIFFGPTNQRQGWFFVSQWEQSSGDKNVRNKMKKIRQTNFSPRGKKNIHFGTHRRCNDYSRRFNRTFWDTPTLRSYSIGDPTL